MTALPNPFLSASDGLHPLSSVAVTLGVDPTALESVTAEIQSSCGGSAHLPEPCADVSSERYDPVNWEVERATSQSAPHEARPADVTSTSPEAMSAGTNTAWVRDCDRIELQEIQSSDGGQRPTDAAPTLGNMLHRPSSLVASGQGIDPTSPSEAFTAVERPLNSAEAARAPLLELHEFLGAGVQAPRPIGPWPRGFDPAAFLRAIEEAWIVGIDEPDPLLFLETFKLGEVA